jgi:hypothetical protein
MDVLGGEADFFWLAELFCRIQGAVCPRTYKKSSTFLQDSFRAFRPFPIEKVGQFKKKFGDF